MSSLYGGGGFAPVRSSASQTGGKASFSKTGYRPVNIQADPRIQELWQRLFSGSAQGLGGGLDFWSKLASGGEGEDVWNQLEAPALRQHQELLGNLASRFSGMGTGARRSSGFTNAANAASTDLAERLQSQRLGLRNQSIQNLLSMSGQLLNTPLSDTALVPRQKPFWQELLMGLAPGIGSGVGSALGRGIF